MWAKCKKGGLELCGIETIYLRLPVRFTRVKRLNDIPFGYATSQSGVSITQITRMKNFHQMTDISSTADSPQSLVAEINESKMRNKWLHMYFPTLDPSQACIADFSCALNQDYLRQGRMYITTDNICFHSFIGPTKLILPIKDIEEIIPKSVLMIPTAILVHTKDQRYEFTSFIFRDKCIRYLNTIRKKLTQPVIEPQQNEKVKQWKDKEIDPLVMMDIKWIFGLGCVILLYQLVLLFRISKMAYSTY
jgi:hypothetical protein